MSVMLIITIALVFLLVLVLFRQINEAKNYWKLRNIPYVAPTLIFGNVFSLCIGKSSIGSLFLDIYRNSTAPVEGFFVFHTPWLLIRDIDVIKSIFVKHFNHFTDRATAYNPRDDELGSSTLFVLQNPQWKYVRNKMSSAMSSGRLQHFYPHICSIGSKFVNNITQQCRNSTLVEIRTPVLEYVTDVLLQFAFGVRSQSSKQADSDFFKVGRQLHSDRFYRNIQMSLYSLAPFLVRIFRMKLVDPTAAEFLRNLFWSVFREAEKNPALGGELIQYLVKLKQQNEPSQFLFDGDKLVAQSAQFFIAGLDTTSLTTSYALYELAANPNIQNKVRDEIRNCTADSENITYEDLNKMYYMDMVINETLRKYPTFPFVDRICTKDYKLPGTDIVIPKGNFVCISLLGLHYDPKYFPDPQKFDPERFSKTNSSSRPTGCYLPFSIGPRSCIGERFAIITCKVALAKIISKFIIGLPGNKPISFSTKTLTLVPTDDINLTFKEIKE